MKVVLSITLSTGLLAPLPALSQQQAQPCSAPEHRLFDFWEGSWEVSVSDGRVVGHNTITRELGGCVLHEHYVTPRRYEGESFNTYDAGRGVWHQTWVDNFGLLLTLEGGFDGERMVLEGETVDTSGVHTAQRITWSRVDGDPDRVRQLWENSKDGGKTWSVSFDGLYRRQPQPTPSYEPATRGTRWFENEDASFSIKMLVEAANLGSSEVEIGEITFPAGSSPRRGHAHQSIEIFYILSGTLEHIVNGTTHVLEPGMVGIVRPGDEVIHKIPADSDAKALVLWVPGGEADRIAPALRQRPVGGF